MGRCEGRLVRQRESSRGKDGRGGLHEKEVALGRSVKERRVGAQDRFCKWVDTNKGTENKPEIRCRHVARDFRGADKDKDLFAAAPPWELKKLLMSHAADRSNGKTRKMLLIDVKKAHLNSECTEDVFIELP